MDAPSRQHIEDQHAVVCTEGIECTLLSQTLPCSVGAEFTSSTPRSAAIKAACDTPAGSADQNNSSPPMLFRIFLAMYLSKRWLQQTIIGPRITTRSHHLAFTREMTTQFLIKLHHYSASREESQFWFEPYLRRRLNDAPTPADLAEQTRVSKTFAFQPLMSVVVPVYDADPTG